MRNIARTNDFAKGRFWGAHYSWLGVGQQHVPSAPLLQVHNCAHFRRRQEALPHVIIAALRILAAP